MSDPLGVIVLGATGSVGRQALEVIEAFPERFRLVGMSAHSRTKDMIRLIERHRPQRVCMVSKTAAAELRAQVSVSAKVQIETGPESLVDLVLADDADLVLAAIVGSAGLPPVYAAVRAGKTVALANKEALVMAGELVMAEAEKHQARILPVDSEHAALHQLLAGLRRPQIRKLVLTASGGPFFGRPRSELLGVTAQEALAHPNWKMGAKISIDSATMMNKGFEIMEARWLFDFSTEDIEVVVHPQSQVHALVETIDGAVLSQVAAPDMRGPIAYALAYPDRLDLPGRLDNVRAPDLFRESGWTFHAANGDKFPALDLCKRALTAGGGTPAALSVADEVVVEAFLADRISFPAIVELLSEVLERIRPSSIRDLRDVADAGQQGAELASALIEQRGKS